VPSGEISRLARQFFEAYGNGDLGTVRSILARFGDGRITRLWMVEALPAYSEDFWS
jgi:hypothetical protein